MTVKTAAKKTTSSKAARSGNPQKRAEAQRAPARASSVADFKARRKATPLPLPSGLTVVAKRQPLESFVLGTQSDVPNPLMKIVADTLETGGKVDPANLMGEEADLGMVQEMFEMVNDICITSVVEPTLHPMVWKEEDVENGLCEAKDVGEDIPEDQRDEDQVYVDELDPMDRMFIFQWVIGGTDDIARFREEASADMASLAEGQGTSPATQ